MAASCETRIGTSGWHYKHWRGPFYPEKLPASKMLEFYTAHFDTVELNNTFYRLPPETGVQTWRESTPAEFRFAAKGSRFLTHMKKLKEPEAGVAKFFDRVERLGEKLGPIVFQLPPWWEVNAERLTGFLEILPTAHRYAFELRNPTWHTPEIYQLLRRHNAAFCIFEIAGFHTNFELTADFTYVRLHGPGDKYQGSYPGETLKAWADRIRDWRKDLHGIYVYFDNDQAGYAVHNALELKGRL
uniref:DUF72 domain-containing protein n=1 Tax=Solibacter usitatus (strain Ellin6076) TaxID=234267 RepID=Q026Q5_SOLUE